MEGYGCVANQHVLKQRAERADKMGRFSQVKRSPSPAEASSMSSDRPKPSRYQGSSSAFTHARSATLRRAGSSSTMQSSDEALLSPRVPGGQGYGRSISGDSVRSTGSAAITYTVSPNDYYSKYEAEPDDYLHMPDKKDRNHGLSCVGCLNVGMLLMLSLLLLMLFAGYPILVYFTKRRDLLAKLGLGPGGTNATGQIPQLETFQLVDPDTPAADRTWKSYAGAPYNLVFSDEFNEEGRTFWPGDDPFWEGVEM